VDKLFYPVKKLRLTYFLVVTPTNCPYLSSIIAMFGLWVGGLEFPWHVGFLNYVELPGKGSSTTVGLASV